MREIKFRAWDNKEKKMNYDVGIYTGYNECIVVEWADGKEYFELENQSELEIMQCTGLKDKNNKEIYEGDIVKLKVNFGLGDTYINVLVVFENGGFKYKIGDLSEYIGSREFDVEVIGNKFENPELLKGEINEKNRTPRAN